MVQGIVCRGNKMKFCTGSQQFLFIIHRIPMKKIILTGLLIIVFQSGRAQKAAQFDIFSYQVPAKFVLKEKTDKLYLESRSGKDYCQLFLYPAKTGTADIEKDFAANWDFFARNPAQGINDPDTLEKQTSEGWDLCYGTAKGVYAKKAFWLSLSTISHGNMTYYTAAVFTHEKFLPAIESFTGSIVPDTNRFVNNTVNPVEQPQITQPAISSNHSGISKSSTRFDDGWLATVGKDYVQVTRTGTEVRLHYIDGSLDDARPNTTDATEYYWSKYVTPYFNVARPEKWAGVQYPVIYFMEGEATNRQTGQPCYVAIKIVYSGGARPVVIIAPDKQSFQQQFPHPNEADRMLNYNKFAITAADITGTWKGSGGGGVEYYNAYSGTYAGMSAVSSTDEFHFLANGTYSSQYRGAAMNNGGTQFSGQDFKGKFTVTDWTLTATNRLGGKTTVYNAQLIAVKSGYLLYLSDPDNTSMNYTLYREK